MGGTEVGMEEGTLTEWGVTEGCDLPVSQGEERYLRVGDMVCLCPLW